VGVSGDSDWIGLGGSGEGGGDEEEESGAEEMPSLEDEVDELEAGITWTLDVAVDGSKFSASSKQSETGLIRFVTCW
jgi:hypothetical protein